MKLVDRQRGALTSQVSLCKGAHVILLGSSGHPRPPAFEGKAFALDETFIALEEVCARASLFVIQRVNLTGASHIGYNGFRLHSLQRGLLREGLAERSLDRSDLLELSDRANVCVRAIRVSLVLSAVSTT